MTSGAALSPAPSREKSSPIKQWIVHTGDPSAPNGKGDILITVYDNEHLVASPRNTYNPSQWDPPLPVRVLGACEGCGHRASDHHEIGACELCPCLKLGGVR